MVSCLHGQPQRPSLATSTCTQAMWLHPMGKILLVPQKVLENATIQREFGKHGLDLDLSWNLTSCQECYRPIGLLKTTSPWSRPTDNIPSKNSFACVFILDNLASKRLQNFVINKQHNGRTCKTKLTNSKTFLTSLSSNPYTSQGFL